MATAVAVYEGKTVGDLELIVLTADPDVVARVMDALGGGGGEIYTRPPKKAARKASHLTLIQEPGTETSGTRRVRLIAE